MFDVSSLSPAFSDSSTSSAGLRVVLDRLPPTTSPGLRMASETGSATALDDASERWTLHGGQITHTGMHNIMLHHISPQEFLQVPLV